MPHSTDLEYSERAIPQYERAVSLAGGEPVRVPLGGSPQQLKDLIASSDAVLLPGSNADVDPSRFHQQKSKQTAAADLRREAIDDLLLDDAYSHRKPILGICYGMQSLNVFRQGSMIQHIPDFLPEATRGKVNHEAGKTVPVAHTVEISEKSQLAKLIANGTDAASPLIVPVNSSHHQSADAIGEGLRIVARCTDDSIIEALEGTSPAHFVVAVQWHPERSVDDDEPSRAIFRALINATK